MALVLVQRLVGIYLEKSSGLAERFVWVAQSEARQRVELETWARILVQARIFLLNLQYINKLYDLQRVEIKFYLIWLIFSVVPR